MATRKLPINMSKTSKIPKFQWQFSDVETVEKIKKLPKAHRGIIARVIWWDFFGLRLNKNRTAAFDEWLTPAPDIEPDWKLLVKSLMKTGYPEWLAVKRLQPKSLKKKTNND